MHSLGCFVDVFTFLEHVCTGHNGDESGTLNKLEKLKKLNLAVPCQRNSFGRAFKFGAWNLWTLDWGDKCHEDSSACIIQVHGF
eukprot:scaffold72479_cov49-Attheya_sp.AAC.2